MSTTEEIVIPLSKTKLTLALLGSIAFIMAGLWFVIFQPTGNNFLLQSPTIVLLVGFVAIIFFGLIAVLIVRKLKDDKPGLIINQDGIADNSGGMSPGIIKWEDLEQISVLKISGQKIIMLMVKNPQEYIDRETSLLKRKTMQLNFKTYDSPLSISANSLKCNFDELLLILNANFKKYKK